MAATYLKTDRTKPRERNKNQWEEHLAMTWMWINNVLFSWTPLLASLPQISVNTVHHAAHKSSIRQRRSHK